jgi:hypothetical protein
MKKLQLRNHDLVSQGRAGNLHERYTQPHARTSAVTLLTTSTYADQHTHTRARVRARARACVRPHWAMRGRAMLDPVPTRWGRMPLGQHLGAGFVN